MRKMARCAAYLQNVKDITARLNSTVVPNINKTALLQELVPLPTIFTSMAISCDKSCFQCPEIVDQPGLDVFGQVYNQWKNKECVCPNCNRSIAASRFAPHLEKCLGMGRNSSRIANRRYESKATDCLTVRDPCQSIFSIYFFYNSVY